jgi:hypothetical protein
MEVSTREHRRRDRHFGSLSTSENQMTWFQASTYRSNEKKLIQDGQENASAFFLFKNNSNLVQHPNFMMTCVSCIYQDLQCNQYNSELRDTQRYYIRVNSKHDV